MLNYYSVGTSLSTVLFVDAGVENYASLLTEINSDVAVFIIDAAQDGVRQITQILKENNYQKVHIISHGAPGCLFLGNSQLSLDSISSYQKQLQQWFSHSSGELLLYGCQVAAGDAGTEFLEKLHQLTGANLAASASLTGNQELGGNWDLEVTVGEVVADVVLAEPAMASYQGVLDRATLVKDIFSGSSSSIPGYLTELNGKLYFAANDGINGRELWVSDGTTAGTQLVADIFGSNNYGFNFGSYPRYLTKLNGKLYFAADAGINGRELWVNDGTTAGTQLVADINSGSYGSNPFGFTEFNGKLYFSADDGINGRELWVTDGTTAGTQLVADINSGSPSQFTELNGKLYFVTNDFPKHSLWVTDGTTVGTQLVADIGNPLSPGQQRVPIRELTKFNGKLYFSADNGANGYEPWVSDGTTAGTKLLKDINPGFNEDSLDPSSSTSILGIIDDKIYFQANDGIHGKELWVTDGTTTGTQLVADINPGFNSSFPNNGTGSGVFNGKLYFFADGGVNGRGLWVSDGTTAGTQLVDEINFLNFPQKFTVVNNELYFSALNSTNGIELFKLTPSNTINGTAKSDRLTGTAGDDDINGLAGNDTLSGKGGNDIIIGGLGNDSLTGGGEDDTLSGDEGNDILRGNAGNDSLTGGIGNDILVGNSGNDILDGGKGKDVLTGDGGKDIFVLRVGDGKDTISDFQLGKDLLGLSNGLTFEDLTFSGNRISVGGEVLATLTCIHTNNLTADNFTFI
jgi:ELWxxDGT repeat protein